MPQKTQSPEEHYRRGQISASLADTATALIKAVRSIDAANRSASFQAPNDIIDHMIDAKASALEAMENLNHALKATQAFLEGIEPNETTTTGTP